MQTYSSLEGSDRGEAQVEEWVFGLVLEHYYLLYVLLLSLAVWLEQDNNITRMGLGSLTTPGK